MEMTSWAADLCRARGRELIELRRSNRWLLFVVWLLGLFVVILGLQLVNTSAACQLAGAMPFLLPAGRGAGYQLNRDAVAELPEASYWLRSAIRALDERDPVDAAADAAMLSELAELRLSELLRSAARYVAGREVSP